jgi:F-box-like
MSSNSLPFGREEIVLCDLLSQQGEELASFGPRISSKQSTIATCKASIDSLEKSLSVASDALELYKQHLQQLVTTHRALSTRFSATLSPRNDALAFAPFLADHLAQRIETCRTEVNAVKEACKKLNLSIASLKEDLCCQKHHLAVSEMSLQASILARDEIQGIVGAIKERFRPIKRIPDEIWLEILEIVVEEMNKALSLNSSDTTTSSVALPLSHVCMTWRRVTLRSSRIWTTIHCSAPAGKNLVKRRKLMSLLLERAKPRPVTLLDKRRYRAERTWFCWWWPEGFDYDVIGQMGRSIYHTMLSDDHPRSGQSSGFHLSIHPSLIFEAKALSSARPPVEGLMSRFIGNTDSLTLVNVVVRSWSPVLLNRLVDLKIVFNSPCSTTGSTELYSLPLLLNEGLRSLHLSHYNSSMVSWPGGAIQLSELTTLFITPHEHHIVNKLDLPALTNLTISKPPGPLCASANRWLPKMAILCKNISKLTLDQFEPMLPVFVGLYPHAPKLEALTFSHSTLEGREICVNLKRFAEEMQKKLPSLTFESCVGLSQEDCESLDKVVDTLKVFRSEPFSSGR